MLLMAEHLWEKFGVVQFEVKVLVDKALAAPH